MVFKWTPGPYQEGLCGKKSVFRNINVVNSNKTPRSFTSEQFSNESKDSVDDNMPPNIAEESNCSEVTDVTNITEGKQLDCNSGRGCNGQLDESITQDSESLINEDDSTNMSYPNPGTWNTLSPNQPVEGSFS